MGLAKGEDAGFDITFPDGLPGRVAAPASWSTSTVDAQGSARQGSARGHRRVRRHPSASSPIMDELRGRAAQAARGQRSRLAPATSSPTRSSSTPRPTPPSSCRTSWSTRKSRSCTTSCAPRWPARGSTRRSYLKVIDKTEEELHAEFRPDAEKRVKTLLVLTEIAKAKGVEVAGARRSRPRSTAPAPATPSNPNLIRYFESERGRNYIRSTLRRSRTVEQLIDEWLAAHPEAPRLVHLEDGDSGPRRESQRRGLRVRRSDRSRRASARSQRPGGRVATCSGKETIRCSCRWSSSPRAVASAPTTSTRGCFASGSSSSATPSRTTSPTW